MVVRESYLRAILIYLEGFHWLLVVAVSEQHVIF